MFYSITTKIRELLKADINVNTVMYGELDEVALNKHTTYPLAHFNISNVTRGKANTYDFQLLLMDVLDQSKETDKDFIRNNNLHDVLNTQELVGMRLLELLERGDLRTDGFVLSGSPTFTPFIERFMDDVAGWEVTFSVQMPNDMDICGVDETPPLPPGQTFNTVIGGLGRSVTTKTDLATLLGVSETIIDEFELDGVNIGCNFNSTYNIPDNCFNANLDIESYHDYSNYVDEIGFQAFRSATGLNDFTLEGASEAGTFAFYQTTIRRAVLPNAKIFNNVFQGCVLLEYADIRSSDPIGTTASTNNVFTACRDGMELIANITTATNNGGNPDGDVDYVTTTLNGTVTYV